MVSSDNEQAALQWQVGVWDRMSPIYLREVDDRFTEITDGVIRRATLQRGQQVLDLGTGTGSVAVGAASAVMPGPSSSMSTCAQSPSRRALIVIVPLSPRASIALSIRFVQTWLSSAP